MKSSQRYAETLFPNAGKMLTLSPMTQTSQTPQALKRHLDRKVRSSSRVIAAERLWPRIWLAGAVLGVFGFVTLLGVWPYLSEVWHKVALGVFGVLLIVALVLAARVPWPSRTTAIRRLERTSGVQHRPASAFEDTYTSGDSEGVSTVLWETHRQRLAAALTRLRPGYPKPQVDRYDPFAARALLVLTLLVLAVVAGDGLADRVASAFRFAGQDPALAARLDVWVNPPAYTLRPPLMVVDGSQAAKNRPRHDGADGTPVQAPEKSTLFVRMSGARDAKLGLEVLDADAKPGAKPERFAARPAAANAEAAEVSYEIVKSATVRVLQGDIEVHRFALKIIPDTPPIITLIEPIERMPRGAMKLSYTLADDYGVVAAEAKLDRVPPSPGDPEKAWARPAPPKGPRPPYERPPQLSLRLPGGQTKKTELFTHFEMGGHPWAGLEVLVTLEARDMAGNIGRSKPFKMVLPERQFRKPLAQAVVEQRRFLLDDPRYYERVAMALEALTLEPEGFIDDMRVYLGLRSVVHRLKKDESRAGLKSSVDHLWHVALRIEDGDLSDAERQLREAQDKLSDALEKGASDEEIKKLMEELKQALDQYMQELTKQAEQQPNSPDGSDQQNETISQKDFERMMREIEEMAKSGSREQAQQLLSEMRDIMERMQSGRMTEQDRETSEEMMKMMQELGDLTEEQQKLMDETFQQEQQQQDKGEGQDPQKGQRGKKSGEPKQGKGKQQSGKGEKKGEQGKGEQQDGQDGEGQQAGGGDLGQRQEELRQRLEKIKKDLEEKGVGKSEQLDEAGDAMGNAEKSIGEGEFGEAAGEQGRALEQLRQGAENMAQEMMKNAQQRMGRPGDAPRDPMGRAMKAQGPNDGASVKVPDAVDRQRAREILEELRKRVGESARPPVELDYIERLLRRF